MDPDRTSVFYGVKRQLRRGRSEDFVTQFFRLAGYNGLAALLMVFLHVVMARLLGPAQYAEYGVFIAIILTFLVAATSIQLIITRFVSYHETRYQHEQVNYLVTKSLKWAFFFGLFLFVLIIFLAGPISEFFHLPNLAATILLGFVLWFTIMQPVFEGAFRGLEKFSALGRLRLTEAATRFALVITLVVAGFSVAGAVFGLGLGTFAALAISYKHIYRVQRLKAVAPSMRNVRRYALPVALAMVSFAVLFNIDLILVKHYFSATDAGVFAAASFLAKIPVFTSLVFVGVLFPRVSRMHSNGKNSAPLLKNVLVVLALLTGVLTLAAFFFAQPLLTTIFGAEYAIGPVLGFYVFAMSMLAISIILITYLLAVRKDRAAFALPLFAVLLTGLLVLFHASTTQVILVVMFALSALAAYAVYMAREVLEFDYFL